MPGIFSVRARCRRLLRDQRGAVALEMLFVWLFLIISILVPIADFAACGVSYLRAWESLRAFGQYLQSNPPADPTNTSAWTPANSTTVVGGSTISKVSVLCGDTSAGVACTSANVGTLPVKYFSFSTTVTLTPLVLTSAFCAGADISPCTFTLTHTERFN